MKKNVLSLLLIGALLTTPALAAQVEEEIPSIAPSSMVSVGSTLYVTDSYHRSIWTVENGTAELLAGQTEPVDQWGQPLGG